MATLDLRLLESIETLVAARLDWLAFELIKGVQAGRTPEESEEAIAAARESIRGNAQPKARGEPQAISVEAKPIPPNEQVEWAAAYVEERLGEALEQLQASIGTLDFIVEGTAERPDKGRAVAQSPDASEPRAVVVLLNPEGGRESARDAVAGAREFSNPAYRARRMGRATARPIDCVMISDVQSAPDTIVRRITALEHASGAGRIFELFVITSLARGLRNAGFSVWLQRSDGTTIQSGDADRRFIQRGGAPTGVPAASAGLDNASVIGFQKRRRQRWESGMATSSRAAVRRRTKLTSRLFPAASRLRSERPAVFLSGDRASRLNVRMSALRAASTRCAPSSPGSTIDPAPCASSPYAIPASPRTASGQPQRSETPRDRDLLAGESAPTNIIARRTGFTVGTAPLGDYYRIEPHRNISSGSSEIDELVRSVVKWAIRNA